MEFFGNIFTHYNYKTTDIQQVRKNVITEINSDKSGFNVLVENADSENISLPDGSPFNNWKEARKFAGPLPFTFTSNQKDKKVLIVEGVRENWKPTPVKVVNFHFSYLDNLNLKELRLANAFIIKNIPYYWKKGKMEKWKQ